jgi:hypothetical protein
MDTTAIERLFREKVCEQIRLLPEGKRRYRVLTPFRMDDGDHLSIVLKQEHSRWLLTDEGHTYLHLRYDMDWRDLEQGSRQKIIADTLSSFMIDERSGEFLVWIEDEDYGDALYSLTQALLRISDVSFLSRTQVRSTFMEDFRVLIQESLPEKILTYDWHDPSHDPEGKYPVDCHVNSMEHPLFLFALPNDDKVQVATISILQFEKWGLLFESVAIFEDQESIGRKVLARYSDVGGKQFSSIGSNKPRIREYLRECTHL